jgi:hypothetical protein
LFPDGLNFLTILEESRNLIIESKARMGKLSLQNLIYPSINHTEVELEYLESYFYLVNNDLNNASSKLTFAEERLIDSNCLENIAPIQEKFSEIDLKIKDLRGEINFRLGILHSDI